MGRGGLGHIAAFAQGLFLALCSTVVTLAQSLNQDHSWCSVCTARAFTTVLFLQPERMTSMCILQKTTSMAPSSKTLYPVTSLMWSCDLVSAPPGSWLHSGQLRLFLILSHQRWDRTNSPKGDDQYQEDTPCPQIYSKSWLAWGSQFTGNLSNTTEHQGRRWGSWPATGIRSYSWKDHWWAWEIPLNLIWKTQKARYCGTSLRYGI